MLLCIFAARFAVAQTIPSAMIVSWKDTAAHFQSTGNVVQQAALTDKIAHQYWNQQSTNEAIAYFNRLLPMYQSLHNLQAEAAVNRNLGTIYGELQDYERSVQYFETSLSQYQTLEDTLNEGPTLVDLASALNHMQKYQEALDYLQESLLMIKRTGDIQLTRTYYGLMAQTYQYLNKTERSMEYFMYYISLDREIQERENRKIEQKAVQAAQQVFLKKKELDETIKELEKVQLLTQEQRDAINQLNAETALKELALSEKEARLKNEAWVRRLLTAGVVLALAVLVLLFVYFRQSKKKNTLLAQKNTSIEKQKHEIEEQQAALLQQSSKLEASHKQLGSYHHKILNSINYAQRIQSAMLPEEVHFQHMIKDSFILFQPRDIVSGDFYWFTETHRRTTGNQLAFKSTLPESDTSPKILIAAMDCTGHGVPGAFMSMIGFNFLNEIEHKGIVQPNEILNTLHLSVRRFLKQDETANKDGMDAAICLVDPIAQTLEFAGANNPMVYIQHGEMHIVKGDRSAVGGASTDRNHRFAKHSLCIKEETWVYLFSDGYQDQFGGVEGRKFLSKNLRNLLLDIHTQPFEQQKQHLSETLDQWKGDTAQIDDVLVIGFKVGGRA